MIYGLLILTALFLTLQNIFKEKYNSRASSGTLFFSGLIALFAMLFFMAVNRDWGYSPKHLIPSAAFAACYAVATVFALLAFREGSVAKTSLILSYSLLIPTFYGIIFLNESVSLTLVFGMAFLAISLWLTNRDETETAKRGGWKWGIFVFIAFAGNGMCSVVQKAETVYLGTEFQNMFMIVALALVSISMFAASLAAREKEILRVTVKKGWHLALLCGLMNGAVNYLVIYLNTKLAASVMFPVLSGASLLFIFPYAILICRERFTLKQYIGFAAGLASVIFLNI